MIDLAKMIKKFAKKSKKILSAAVLGSASEVCAAEKETLKSYFMRIISKVRHAAEVGGNTRPPTSLLKKRR